MPSIQEIKESILKLTKDYYNAVQKEKDNKPFDDGDRINYSARCYDENEMVNLVDSSLEFWLTSGRYTERFEKEFANFLGVKYALLVNSGSSANLLAFMALTSPLLKERRIKRGDEVITVSCGFPTTVTPILQYGAVPVFVDVTFPTCNIDTGCLEKAYSDKTKAVMLAHTLGNPFDMQTVTAFCKKYNLFLIEDNCDALGSKYFIDGVWKFTGTIGDIGTSSFYPPHHITTGEGGAVYTDNPLLKKIMMSMRDWGRDCVCPSGKDNFCNNRFNGTYGTLPKGYDHKYVYSHFGYNLKATDMQAAIGCGQIEKINDFIYKRQQNYNYLVKALSDLRDKIDLIEPEKNSQPSWFGLLITVKDKAISRNDIIKCLESNNIQTRMLFSGNLTRHPCFEGLEEGKDFRIAGGLDNTDYIMNNSFWIGVYPGMNKKMLDFMSKKIHDCVK